MDGQPYRRVLTAVDPARDAPVASGPAPRLVVHDGRVSKRMVALAWVVVGTAFSACTDDDSSGEPSAATTECPDRDDQTDLAYVEGGDPLQRLDLYQPDVEGCDAVPLVVWVHGGGWQVGDKAQRHGRQGVAVDRCRVGGGERQLPAHRPRGARSTSASWRRRTTRTSPPRWAGSSGPPPELGIDPERIALLGHSAGAGIVAALAADPAYLDAEDLAPADLTCVAPLDTEGFDIDRLITGGGVTAGLYQTVFGTDPRALGGSVADHPRRRGRAPRPVPRHPRRRRTARPGRRLRGRRSLGGRRRHRRRPPRLQPRRRQPPHRRPDRRGAHPSAPALARGLPELSPGQRGGAGLECPHDPSHLALARRHAVLDRPGHPRRRRRAPTSTPRSSGGRSRRPSEEYGGYVMAQVAGGSVAGIGPLPEDMPTAWRLYFASDDVDATATAVADHGGTVIVRTPATWGLSAASAWRRIPPAACSVCGSTARTSARRWSTNRAP